MTGADIPDARPGALLVSALGVGLLAVHITHLFGSGEDFSTFLYGILIPMLFTVGVIAGGAWLWGWEVDDDYVSRVGVWCVIGATSLALGAVLTILYQQAEGASMSDRLFVVANSASGGAAVGLVVGIYDSRQRMARAEANRLNGRLTVLNRILRHDIRNHAQIIQGNAEFLADGGTGDGRSAQIILRAAADLVELGEHARDIERMMQDDAAERRTVDLAELVETNCERLRREYPAAEIDVSIPESRPVSAHPLLDSAVANVVENAVEHNDKPTPHVEIEIETLARTVEMRVADDGPGIPRDELDVIERGYETELSHAGGLGLWIIDWIVSASGGTVQFEGNEPEGTVVRIRLDRPELGAEAPATRTDRGVAR
jgi:signal transduction histidine kinase